MTCSVGGTAETHLVVVDTVDASLVESGFVSVSGQDVLSIRGAQCDGHEATLGEGETIRKGRVV